MTILLGGCYGSTPGTTDGEPEDSATERDETVDDDAAEETETACAVPDRDRDGWDSIECGGSDCNDDDPDIHPGAPDNVSGWRFETIEPGMGPTVVTVHAGVIQVACIGFGDGYTPRVDWARNDGAWTIETVDTSLATTALDMAVGPDGTPRLVYWGPDDGSGQELRYAVRESSGWRVETVARVPDGVSAAIVVDAGGVVHVAFSSWDGSRVVLLHADNASGSWTSETIDATPNSGYSVRMIAEPSGIVRAVYQRSGTTEDSLLLASLATGRWDIERIGRTLRGQPLSLARDAGGALHVLGGWLGDAGPYGTNASGSWEYETTGSTGIGGAMALDPEGQPHVVGTVLGFDFSELLMFAVREADGWRAEQIPSGTNIPWMSIAVDEDGYDHLVYQDGGVVYATNRDAPPADGIDQDCDGVDG